MDCKLFDEKKLLYMSGELSSEERDAVRNHLESCSRCKLEFQALEETMGLVKELPHRDPSEDCLAGIRQAAREREAGGMLRRLKDMFTPQEVFVRRPALMGALAVVTVVVVSLYLLVRLKEPVTSLEWEDLFFEQKIAQLEESLEQSS